MTYKPEIDGLRAVAVFLVLLCHMQLGAEGGFVGVDVFFVISGFLITSIVITGIEQKRFNLIGFYARRLIRLYPALLVTIALSFIAGYFLLDIEALKNFASSARYALASNANNYFSKHLGYFDPAAEKQIFLHTWSLGVEWQFYLIWPILVWIGLKIHRTFLIALIALLTIASLMGAQYMLGINAQGAYYLMHYRAFELGIGALLVFLYPKNISAKVGVSLTAIGLITIIACAFIYTAKTPFPGWTALIPCLGAAACMWGSKAFDKANFLRAVPVVFIGKISYSVYLVHWPLLYFYRYVIHPHLNTVEKICLLIASLLLGAVLYTLIEKRINWKRIPYKTASILIIFVLVLAMRPVFRYIERDGQGLPSRIGENLALQDYQYSGWDPTEFPTTATLGDTSSPLTSIIGGDSFAGFMSVGLHEHLNNRQEQTQRFYNYGCVMFVAGENSPFGWQREVCYETAGKFLEAAIQHPELPAIIFQAWGGPALILDSQGKPFDPKQQEEYHKTIRTNLDQVHAKIGNERPLFLVGSQPYRHWGSGEKSCYLRPALAQLFCKEDIKPYAPEASPVMSTNHLLQTYAQEHENVYYIDLVPTACPDGICTPERNAKIYFDGYHVSPYGADIFSKEILNQIDAILQTRQNQAPTL